MRITANSTPKERGSPQEPGLRRAARSGLDVMLTDAVLEGDHVLPAVLDTGLGVDGEPEVRSDPVREAAAKAVELIRRLDELGER